MIIPADDETKPVDKIDQTDEMLVTLAKRGGKAIKILVGGLIVITVVLTIAVGYLVYNNSSETSRINNAVSEAAVKQQQQLQKQCDFYSLIAQLPIINNTTKTGITLVADARTAYVGLACSPSLLPPSAELVRLAQKFDVPIVG